MCHLQFASHKVYCVTHSVPTHGATIQAVELAVTNTILFTTAEPHGFIAKRTCGQLYLSHQQVDMGVMTLLLEKPLKIATVPSPVQFTIHSPVKGLQPTELLLADLSSRLQAKTLTFGYVPADFHAQSCYTA